MENDSSSSKSSVDDIINRVFFKKYHCIKKLGEGSFGKIYEAVYKSEHFALKFEDIKSNSNLLENEASIMNYLKGPNIPLVRSYGTSGNYNILIMQLMGKSLEDLINIKKTFPIKTVCLIGYQMINVLEYIHNKHFVHRDLKPDNFVVGLNELSKYLYLLDFGLAKKYRSTVTLKQYPLINKKKLTGTARYASINALRGFEQSRRDDLESAGYVLMYFLRGSLPWQGIPGKTKDERYKKILQKKNDTSAQELCEGFPEELAIFIDYVKSLTFMEVPDYNYLRQLLKNILKKNKFYIDFYYDWDKEKPNIDEDNIIYTNDYGIEYNGKNEWLNRNNDINFNNICGKTFKLDEENDSTIYTKPILSINHIPSFKKSKTIAELNTNYKNHKSNYKSINNDNND